MNIKNYLTSNKPLLIAVLALAVVVMSWYFLPDMKKAPNSSSDAQNKLVDDPGKLADFKIGKVKRIEGNIVIVVIEGKDQKVVITDDTQITIQTKVESGYTNIPVDLRSIGIGQQLVIFYELGKPDEFVANKIQILPF